MAFKGVVGFYWGLGGLASLLFSFFSLCFSSLSSTGGLFLSSFFVFDFVRVFLTLISFLLLVSLFSWWGRLSFRCRFMLLLSIFSSFLCYCSLKVLVF